MEEKYQPINYRIPAVRKSNFTLLGKTYVDLRAIVAFEQTSDSRTKIYLDSGHEILVDLPAHEVRNIMEAR